MPDSQITQWIERVSQGDSVAAEKIFHHYRSRLEQLARRRLAGSKQRVADEEDGAVMALNSFFCGARAQKFRKFDDREDLWQLLALLTTRKAIDLVNRERAQKRGNGGVLGESAFGGSGASGGGLHEAVDLDSPPDLAVQIVEQLDNLLESLGDDILRRVALGKLEGLTNQELATQLNVGLRTVERKLKLIRAIWEERVEA